MSTSLVQALADTHFGDLSTDAFLNATQAGRPVDAPGPLAVRSTGQERLQACLAAPEGRLIWEGPIPRSEKPGHFFIVNPYATKLLTHKDPEELKNGKGLTADTIAEISGVFVEVDEALDGGRLAIEEQAKIYDQIEADTGLRFSTAVLSGDHRESARGQLNEGEVLEVGKSLHVVIACRWQGAGPDALKLRQEATDALCAIAGADPLVRDVARKQRVGGVVARLDGKVRVQTCIRADSTAVFDLQDVRDRLVAYAASLGINVQARLEAMHTAFQARQKAKAWLKAAEQGNVSTFEADEAARDLRDLALEIRVSGVVLPSQRKLMGIIGVPKGQVAVTTPSGATRVIATGHGAGWDASTTVLTHTSGQSGLPHALWATHRRDYRVPDVHCPQHADAHASAYLTKWSGGGGYSIHCPSCGRIDSAAILLPGQVVPEFKSAKQGAGPIKIFTPEEADARHKAQQAQIQREHEEFVKAEQASAKYKARGLHHGLLLQAQAVLDLVEPEIRVETGDRLLAGLLADSDENQAECLDCSLVDTLGTNPNKVPPDPLDTQPAGSIIPAHLVELAMTRYRELGCDCKRGPTAVQTGAGGKLKTFKLACRARTCDVCGPRGRRAERAAIAGSIEALGEGWAMALMPDPQHENQLGRWVGKDQNRVVLTVKISPTHALTLLAWAPGHGPETRTRRKLDAAFPVKVWADQLFDLIDEDVHPGERERAVQGTQWLCVQINAVKAELLRIKKKDPMAPTGGTLITAATPKDVVKAVKQALGPDFYEGLPDKNDPKPGVKETRFVRNPKGKVMAPDWQPGRVATPEELSAACANAEIFKGRKRKPKKNDLNGYFDLDMSA